MSSKQVYTVETDVPAKAGEGKPRRYFKTTGEFATFPHDVKNLHDNLLHGVSVSGNDPFLGHRPITNGTPGPYIWQTYNEVLLRVKNLGSGLVHLGLKKDEPVGLFSVNRPEWVIGEHACFAYSLITLPLYDTLGDEAIEFISNQTEVSTVIATKDKAKTLFKLASKIPSLKTVIIMDGADQSTVESGARSNLKVLSLEEVEKSGASNPLPIVPTTSDSIATICYTSGTTGQPKGVLLSHGNLLSFPAGGFAWMKTETMYQFTKDDVHISYLPLAHVFERIVQAFLTHLGARIGFYQGDTLKLLDDVAELKPTIFVSVPRLYNRIYDKVMAQVNGGSALKAKLFNLALSAKKANLDKGYVTHFLWDRLVFSKVKARLGGNVRVLLTGAAPISKEVVDFLRCAFSCEFYEGYGQTETTGGASCTVYGDLTSGHIGVPMPQCEIKLIDVPSMNYSSKDKPYPRGEICVRGSNIFKGYYKAPEKTAETLDADGWCHTGDVGMWDEQGRLKIIDRVKNIFKLAQGEYIAPEKIEMVYIQHELVAQIFVYGDSLQATLVAIVVPDEDTTKSWAAKNGIQYTTLADLVKDEKVRESFKKTLEEHGKSHGLKGFENVKNIHLESTPFSVENDLLTPTFKLKRHDLGKKYRPQIDQLYSEMTKQ